MQNIPTILDFVSDFIKIISENVCNKSIMTEWKYFRNILQSNPIDNSRLKAYLSIFSRSKEKPPIHNFSRNTLNTLNTANNLSSQSFSISQQKLYEITNINSFKKKTENYFESPYENKFNYKENYEKSYSNISHITNRHDSISSIGNNTSNFLDNSVFSRQNADYNIETPRLPSFSVKNLYYRLILLSNFFFYFIRIFLLLKHKI